MGCPYPLIFLRLFSHLHVSSCPRPPRAVRAAEGLDLQLGVNGNPNACTVSPGDRTVIKMRIPVFDLCEHPQISEQKLRGIKNHQKLVSTLLFAFRKANLVANELPRDKLTLRRWVEFR